MSYRFTGKERDEERGYTYFGARYLDVRRGLWTQTDPTLGEYIPTAGTQADKLPGMGGLYNLVNAQLYHYAGSNPVKYTDPDGNFPWAAIPIVIGIGLLFTSDKQPSPTPVNPDIINNKLSKIYYNDPSKASGPNFTSPYTRETSGSITLESHPLLALASALPTGNYSESDYSNPNQMRGDAVNTTGSVLDGLSLASSVIENLSYGHLGDVTLSFKKYRGKITEWTMTLTTFDPLSGKSTGRQIFSREDALKYLNENKETLKNDSEYKKLQNLLD